MEIGGPEEFKSWCTCLKGDDVKALQVLRSALYNDFLILGAYTKFYFKPGVIYEVECSQDESNNDVQGYPSWLIVTARCLADIADEDGAIRVTTHKDMYNIGISLVTPAV